MEKITDIFRAQVFTEDGEYLGNVFEIRCSGEPEHGSSNAARVVSEVFYGRRDILNQLGFKKIAVRSVPWDRVKTFEHGRIVIADS